MNKNKKRLIVLGVVVGILFVVYLCYTIHDLVGGVIDPEYLKERVGGSMYFDPETILLTIENNDEVSFYDEPILKEDERSDVVFSFEEYLELYQKIYLYVWDEPIETLEGDLIFFRTSCDRVNEGFFYSDIILFTVRKGPSKVRVVRKVNIYADEGTILWGEDQYSGHLGKWGSLDLYNLKMKPVEVIKKAEIEGFSCQRLQLEDKAIIDLGVGAGRFLEGWNVDFDDKYEIILNKDTGEIVYRDLP
jgi:hypothetical protein